MTKSALALYSNSPGQPTGYGQQAEQFLFRAKRAGHNVAALSNYGLEGTISTIDLGNGKIPHYPRGADGYSNDVIAFNAAHFKAQNPNLPFALLTLYDVWVLNNPLLDQFNIGSWTPIDHNPVPPQVAAWCAKPNVTPIAMTKFGRDALGNAGIDSVYVPHGMDSKTFKPTDKCSDGTPGVDYLQSDGRFVVGMVAANKGVYPNRKAFGENLMAFSMLARKYDDVLIYLHTEAFGAYGGLNLGNLLESLQIDPKHVRLVDQVAYKYGIDRQTLAAGLSACDVGLVTSYGEGFGIPTVEFQMCGTPVIGSNFAATAELVSDEGWLVDGQPLWDAPQRSYFNIPSVIGIFEALEAAYLRGKKTSLTQYQATIDFAKQYDADIVFDEFWKPAIAQIAK
jgi:glycosyltransferase involved in cell wall biosynthesis